jgi:hypothetical protein
LQENAWSRTVNVLLEATPTAKSQNSVGVQDNARFEGTNATLAAILIVRICVRIRVNARLWMARIVGSVAQPVTTIAGILLVAKTRSIRSANLTGRIGVAVESLHALRPPRRSQPKNMLAFSR